MFSENIFWNQGLILINILGLISTLLLIFKVKNVLYCLSIFYWSILIYLIYFWILRNWNIILKQAEKLKREMEWFAKVPWLPWITLRYFPLFMLSSASAVVVPYPHSWWKVIHLLCQLQKEASIFETFIYWAQKYTVTIYLNENTSLYLLR